MRHSPWQPTRRHMSAPHLFLLGGDSALARVGEAVAIGELVFEAEMHPNVFVCAFYVFVFTSKHLLPLWSRTAMFTLLLPTSLTAISRPIAAYYIIVVQCGFGG